MKLYIWHLFCLNLLNSKLNEFFFKNSCILFKFSIFTLLKVGDIHIQPTSHDFCDTPNQMNPEKKGVYNFFEGTIKNSGSNIL